MVLPFFLLLGHYSATWWKGDMHGLLEWWGTEFHKLGFCKVTQPPSQLAPHLDQQRDTSDFVEEPRL